MFHTALGLGFLTKGPIILLLVGVTVVPYLAFSRRLTSGLRRLGDGWGLLIFVVAGAELAGRRPAERSRRLRVWSLEMSEKTGLSHILEHRWHAPLIGQWPGLVLPWTLSPPSPCSYLIASAIPARAATSTGNVEAFHSGHAWRRIMSGSPGGGPWETSCCFARGWSPSRIITFPVCPAWPC